MDAGVDRLVGKNPTRKEILVLHQEVAGLLNACNVPIVGQIVCLATDVPQ